MWKANDQVYLCDLGLIVIDKSWWSLTTVTLIHHSCPEFWNNFISLGVFSVLEFSSVLLLSSCLFINPSTAVVSCLTLRPPQGDHQKTEDFLFINLWILSFVWKMTRFVWLVNDLLIFPASPRNHEHRHLDVASHRGWGPTVKNALLLFHKNPAAVSNRNV